VVRPLLRRGAAPRGRPSDVTATASLFVGIQTQDRDARAAGRAFIDRFDFTFPNVIDDDSRVSIAYGLFGVPETFFVRPTAPRVQARGTVTPELMTEKVEALLR
jgi:cytochrome c biogenesis protein CcmG, thiol:disulfide interchange protein DsbE